MTLDEIQFPIYVIGTENITKRDGVIFADGFVVDDTNMKGDSIGMRRLQTSLPNLYDLKYMIKSLTGLVKHRGTCYIDNKGRVFHYIKENFYPLKYHKITNVSKKDTFTLLWLEGINSPIEVERPPTVENRWAGMIHRGNAPWFLWDYSTEKEKDSRRKV